MSRAALSAAPLPELLAQVSRSFGLSIRLLPASLRDTVGLAYLLARATDSLADTSTALVRERAAALDRLHAAVCTADAEAVRVLAAAFAPQQAHDAERVLIARLPECLAHLHGLQRDDLADVQRVLGHIVRGQLLDLQRFPDAVRVRALPTRAALEEYTYLVAGSVGEFWTSVCARHVPAFASLPPEDLRALGRRFGSGLQLVNITRDLGEDLACGRCYLPGDELAAQGVPLDAVRRDDAGLLKVWRHWQHEAALRMQDGIRYACALRHARMRAAVALPALLGMRTLEALAQSGERALATRVKVPRRAVYAMLARMAVTLCSPRALQAQAARWDNRAQ